MNSSKALIGIFLVCVMFAVGDPQLASGQGGSPPAGSHLWSKSFGSTGADDGRALAVDGSSNVVVAGAFQGTVDFGGGPLTGGGMFVAKFSGVNGSHLWSKSYGSTTVYSVATDGTGNVVVTGWFEGTVNFGGGPLTSLGSADIFVAKFSGADGSHLWSKSFGSADDDRATSVALDGGGNVVVTGWFSQTVDFGGGPLKSAGIYDIFVVKLSGADGTHLWSKRFGAQPYEISYGVAVDGSGNVVVTGLFQGAVDFGGGLLTSAGLRDIFVAKFSGANGSHLWSKSFGSPGQDEGSLLAIDASGNVVMTGVFQGTVDFGGGALTSVGGLDMFVAKLSGSNGSHLWSKRFGSAGDDRASGLAVDGSGNVVLEVVGQQGTWDFGGGPLTGTMFVAKFSGVDGSHSWSKGFGGSSYYAAGNEVAVDGSGNVVVTGLFQGTVDFGGGPLTSAGSNDIFVLKLEGTVPRGPKRRLVQVTSD